MHERTANIKMAIGSQLVVPPSGDLTISVRPDRTRRGVPNDQTRQRDRRFDRSPQQLREGRHSGRSFEKRLHN